MNSKRNPRIFMADLTYDTTVVSLESFPIGIGYVAAYAQKIFPGVFDFSLFKFPDVLFDAIDKQAPEILALSFFPWNHSLGLFVAEYYRARKPDGVVIIGGADFPLDAAGQVDFLSRNKQVDILVSHDGEFGFSKILQRYVDGNNTREHLLSNESIAGCSFLDYRTLTLKQGSFIHRMENMDEIPSPYLTGLMDDFFDNQLLTPMIQATRGCPFTCAYCWAGNGPNSAIKHFSVQRVCAELDYIAQKRSGKTNQLLTFSDANFGMYSSDEEIAEKISFLQKTFNFPSSFYAPCGKNNKDRVFSIIQKIKNAAAIVSVQSTDSTILSNVHRQPIDIEEYKEIVEKFHGINIPVETEIITGMPGETRQTHLNTIRELIHMGMDEIHPFTLMFLEGTDLNSAESQIQNEWDKRFRILPRNFGKYRNRICFEIETVGVGSKTFTFEDYLFFRGLHGALRIVFNHAFFQEFTRYLVQSRVDVYDFCMLFYEEIQKDSGPAGNQFRSFLQETRDEIWDEKEALLEYYANEVNYHKLLSGEKGENLLGKYKVITVCDNFKAWGEFFYQQVLTVTRQSNADVEAELLDIKKHVMAKADNLLTEANMHGTIVRISTNYNVLQWQKDNYQQPLSAYKLEAAMPVDYQIKDASKLIVKEILTLYSQEKSSLWKAVSSRYYLPMLFRDGTIVSL